MRLLDFEEYVSNLKRKINVNKDKVLFVCIGTSEILWDSLGPLVGSFLKEKLGGKKVIGDMNNNICMKKDLICYSSQIRNGFVVAIDTAISSLELHGKIFITNKPTVMGMGLNRNKGIIGNISIKMAISDIESIDEKYIKNKAEFIGKGICEIEK